MARVSLSDTTEGALNKAQEQSLPPTLKSRRCSGKSLADGERAFLFSRHFCCYRHQTVFTEDPWHWAAPLISALLSGCC